ncbi:MAG TPA: SHOCT domain-containing protein [Candidatus Dormibacteraeota bacterium]|nr:SHOCT domain-containing protein [Candidatus Dormibacteraeota bacterium]
MMYDYSGYGNGYDAGGSIFMLLLMALIIVTIIVVVRHFNRDLNSHQSQDTALNLLKERYVKGEIDKKEFEEKRKDLSN